MSKKLAIEHHLIRPNEVIELLEMMGGKNKDNADGCSFLYYTLCTPKTNNPNNEKVICGFTNLKMQNDFFDIFTLERFWKKYPYKLNDKVLCDDGLLGVVTKMEWDCEKSDMKYYISFKIPVDNKWYSSKNIICKYIEAMEAIRKKLAIKGHPTRGKEVIELLEMLGGNNNWHYDGSDGFVYFIEKNDKYITYCGKECLKNTGEYIIYELEEFLEKYPYKVGDKVEYIKYNDEFPSLYVIYKMCWTGTTIEYTLDMNNFTCLAKDIRFYKKDCKKCGLRLGSVQCFQCFDKDCPNNSPKSNAVGLKDGKVIDCKVNKETDVNDEVKPIFKVGDEIAKADGLTNSFTVTGVTSKYYSLVAPYNSGVGVLPVNKQDEYILVNRAEDKEPEPKAPILSNRCDYAEGKCGYVIPDGYEFYCIKEGFQTEIILKPKKPTYPKTYKECCDILGIDTMDNDAQGYKADLIIRFQELFIARNAYWKIAGEEMGLGKPWEPKFGKYILYSINFYLYKDSFELYKGEHNNSDNRFLVFPTEEMRDIFYENFKELIEQCKELL